MQIDAEVDLRSLRRGMQREVLNAERAVTAGTREAGDGLKNDWRAQVTAARLGRRLANTIRRRSYPSAGASIDAAALVYSNAPDIVSAFDEGALIRSKDGFWLAIPTEAAGRGSRKSRLTPGEWERRRGLRLRFVYRPSGIGLLVADEARVSKRGVAQQKRGKRRKDGTLTGAQTVPIFILVPQVRLAKRLDLDGPARNWGARLPAMIVAAWDRLDGVRGDG